MPGQVVVLQAGKTVGDVCDAFLARSMAETTRRSYRQTMDRLSAVHGGLVVSDLTGRPSRFSLQLRGAIALRPPGTATSPPSDPSPPTPDATGWLAGDPAAVLERRKEPEDRTKAIPDAAL